MPVTYYINKQGIVYKINENNEAWFYSVHSSCWLESSYIDSICICKENGFLPISEKRVFIEVL